MSELKFKWELPPDFVLTSEELKKLQTWVRERKTNEKTRVAVNDWFVIEIATNTGLRVAEIRDLRCSDIIIQNNISWVYVRDGKYHKSRRVFIEDRFIKIATEYIKQKEVRGEQIAPEDILLYSPRSKGKFTERALEYCFDRCAKGAGIESSHTIHHCRHTYASLLYLKTKNLRFVQDQLGHENIHTTEIYTNMRIEDIKEALKNLF
jgi:integrase/recombinase XerD